MDSFLPCPIWAAVVTIQCVKNLTDQQLLRAYAERQSERSFAELVRRHVDLVYSAALRMVRDPHLAEDVAQGVFVALAQNARTLTDRSVLSGWLHRTAQNLAANVVWSDVRRRAREQEAAVMNELLAAESAASWEQTAPHLDAALGDLSEPDRDALLLRYFERKSAREMAGLLGISEDAAQKRVSRAVERLRELFAQRGVAAGASGLVVLIAANAVQAAPVGLAAAISAAAALAGATLAATATKAIAMTTLQKTLITAAFVASISTGIYEARQALVLRQQVRTLQQQQAPLAEQIRQLLREREDASRELAALRDDNDRLNRNTAELLKLRGEMTRLREDSRELGQLKEAHKTDPPWVEALRSRVARLKELLEQMPDKSIPELQFLGDQDWIDIAKDVDLNTDAGARDALSLLRRKAKMTFAPTIWQAWNRFMLANAGEVPSDAFQLKPYFESGVDDKILQRYEIVAADQEDDFSLFGGRWVITEKAPVDNMHDFRIILGMKGGVGAVAFRGSGR